MNPHHQPTSGGPAVWPTTLRGSGGGGGSSYASASGSRQAGPPAFSAQMRDRQARGKDPLDGFDDEDGDERDMDPNRDLRLGAPLSPPDAVTVQERRRHASAVLENPELLLMMSQSTGDSLTALRLRFTAQLCGFPDPTKPLRLPGGATPGASAGPSSSSPPSGETGGGGVGGAKKGGKGPGGGGDAPKRGGDRASLGL